MSSVAVSGPELGVAVCARRLAHLGARPSPGPISAAAGGFSSAALELDDGWATSAECAISWHGPARAPVTGPASEATVQALSGLMHVHGLERGAPRRLGIELASVMSGLLAATGILATVVGARRGQPVSAVETSLLQGALVPLSQYVARATCAGPRTDWLGPAAGSAPGPPFPTADGRWVEMETLDPGSWQAFWSSLGVGRDSITEGWNLFGERYAAAAASMPPGFHEATAGRTLEQVATLARSCGVSLCPVRRYAEVLADQGLAGLAHPSMADLGSGQVAAGACRPRPTPRTGSEAVTEVLPLAGVRVVEATSRIQGPLGGQLLRMLGAEVVRVELPGGDVARMVPPLADGTGAFFLAMHRGKEPVELDLSRPAARSALLDLVGDADVFLHNWRPGKAAEWGLGPDDLAARNPRIVSCHASGWGPRQASCPPIAMEFLVQAYAGLGEGLNPDDQPPFPSRVLITDATGGVLAAEAAVAGLERRGRTGRGCHVESSLLGGAMALQDHVLADLAEGREKGRRAGRPVWGPLDRPVPAGEGFLALSVADDAALARLCEVCEVDPGRAVGEADAAVAARLTSRPAGDWEELLVGAGIPASVCAGDLASLPADPRLAPLFEPLGGTSSAPAAPWRFRS